MNDVPVIGRGCTTKAFFTNQIARALGFPELSQSPDETEQQFLIRRLAQIQWCNRHWALARLDALTPELLELAAMQICAAAADYCQDRNAERGRAVLTPPLKFEGAGASTSPKSGAPLPDT